jgi:hypothetical protein
MAKVDNSLKNMQLRNLGLIGLVIIILFAAGFAWAWYYIGIWGHGGVDVLLTFLPFCILPYFLVITVYVGFFTAKFAEGRWRHTWPWGLTGSILTLLFMIGSPELTFLIPHYSSAIFVFLSPVVSTLLILSLISIRRKAAY